jgi:hypothetical protein
MGQETVGVKVQDRGAMGKARRGASAWRRRSNGGSK